MIHNSESAHILVWQKREEILCPIPMPMVGSAALNNVISVRNDRREIKHKNKKHRPPFNREEITLKLPNKYSWVHEHCTLWMFECLTIVSVDVLL